MLQMPSQEALQEKWAPILNHEGMDSIKDNHRAMVTAQLLENQEQMLKEEREFLSEAPWGLRKKFSFFLEHLFLVLQELSSNHRTMIIFD